MSTQARPALPVNCYTQRAAVKRGPCFICSTHTSSLLMTEHETPRDWFYVCESHLQSASFCTASKETSKGATAQEPAPRAPAEEHKASSDDKDSSDATTGNKDEDTNDDTKTQPKGNSESEMPAKKPRYILSSHYFYLRQRPFIKRWEQQQAELLAKQLPRAPRHQPQ